MQNAILIVEKPGTVTNYKNYKFEKMYVQHGLSIEITGFC